MASGLPPLAVVFADPAHEKWTHWDLKLITAHEIATSMMNGEGVPYHWDNSERVVFDTEVRTSRSLAAVQRREKKMADGKGDNFGKYIVAVPRTVDDGPMPTLEEFNKERALKAAMTAGSIRVGGEFDNSAWAPVE